MAGFMSGFGSAFAQSFQQDQQVKAQHNEDMFRMQYQDYISQRDYRQKQDLENKKNLRLARSIVSGIDGQPPEAVSWAYDQLSGGASPEYVTKYLTDNQGSVTQSATTKPGEGATASSAQPADPRDSLTGAATNSVDSQMKASGMQAPASGGIFGAVKQGLHNVFGGSTDRAGRQSERRTQEIAQASGTTSQQVQDTLAGKPMPGDPLDSLPNAQIKFTPRGENFQTLVSKANTLGDAQALAVWVDQPLNHATPEQIQYAHQLYDKFKQQKANEIAQNAYNLDPTKVPQRGLIRKKDGTGYENTFVTADYSNGDPLHPIWKDQNGNEVDPKMVAPVGQNQEKDMQAVADEASEAMKPYQQAKQDQKNFIRTASDYINLMKDNQGKLDGKVMDITGDVTQLADRWRRAAVNISDLVFPKGNIEDASTAIGELDNAEKKVRDQLASGKLIDAVSQNAAKATLVDIQGTKLAYQMAAQANGSTKGISNADFQHFKDVVSGGGNPTTAAKGLALSIKQGNANLKNMESDIKKGKGKAAYYAGKYPNAPNGFDMGQGFDQEIAADPEIADALKNILQGESQEDNPGGQVDTSVDMPDWAKNTNKPILDSNGNQVTPEMWHVLMSDPKYAKVLEKYKKINGL